MCREVYAKWKLCWSMYSILFCTLRVNINKVNDKWRFKWLQKQIISYKEITIIVQRWKEGTSMALDDKEIALKCKYIYGAHYYKYNGNQNNNEICSLLPK